MNTEYWGRYKGKVAEVSTAVNNSTLEFHGVEDGVKSYGRVVNLMLAWYREQ